MILERENEGVICILKKGNKLKRKEKYVYFRKFSCTYIYTYLLLFFYPAHFSLRNCSVLMTKEKNRFFSLSPRIFLCNKHGYSFPNYLKIAVVQIKEKKA